MKLFWKQIIICLLLGLVASSLAGHRKKTTSGKLKKRPIRTTVSYRQTLHRRTTPRYANSQLFSSKIKNMSPDSINSLIAKQIPDGEEFQCQRRYEVFVNAKTPSVYRMCVPVAQNWVVYTYTCPNSAVFDVARKQCIVTEQKTTTMASNDNAQIVPESVPASQYPVQTTPRHNYRLTSGNPITFSPYPESSTYKNEVSSPTDPNSSSSSSEEFDNYTFPSEILNKRPEFTQELMHNQLMAQSQLINDLLNRPSNPPPVLQQPSTQNHHAHTQSGYQPETSQRPPQTLTTAETKSTTSPSQNEVTSEHGEPSKFIYEYETPQTRWKPSPQPTTSTAYSARFPGRRPSSE